MLYWWLGRRTWWIKGGRLYSVHGCNTLISRKNFSKINKTVVSSAKVISIFDVFTIPLMYNINQSGPNIELWGRLYIILSLLDLQLLRFKQTRFVSTRLDITRSPVSVFARCLFLLAVCFLSLAGAASGVVSLSAYMVYDGCLLLSVTKNVPKFQFYRTSLF